MPTCCLSQRQLVLQHGLHDLDLLSTDSGRDGFCCLLTQPSFSTLNSTHAGQFDSLHRYRGSGYHQRV